MQAPTAKVTVPAIRARKGGERIVMVTAYDAPSARVLDQSSVDIVLVGDSLGMVVLGYETTLEVTMADMLHHTRAAARGVKRALLVADMPYLSYHASGAEAVRNAGAFLKQAHAEAVKIEGGARRARLVERLALAEVPVMGHVGLTPQSFHAMGGFKVQGRDRAAAKALIEDAVALERAGAFAIVVEGTPPEVGREITEAVSVPTIGIGAGPDCDGQVLVYHDLLGLGEGRPPRFVRRYAELGQEAAEAVARFAAEVRAGSFPSAAECYGPAREAER